MEIITERLKLREFTEKDYEFIFELENNDFIQRFEADGTPSIEEIDKNFARTLLCAKQIPRLRYSFIITTLTDNKPVGRIVLWEVGTAIREWEIGWDVHPQYTGNGYATEAARAILGFAFNTLGVHRVQALCNDENINSERVMIKASI